MLAARDWSTTGRSLQATAHQLLQQLHGSSRRHGAVQTTTISATDVRRTNLPPPQHAASWVVTLVVVVEIFSIDGSEMNWKTTIDRQQMRKQRHD